MNDEGMAAQAASDRNSDRIQVVSRAFSVLHAFSPAEPYLALDELSRRLALNKTSLLRILRTLEEERMVHREGDHYSLGPAVLDLANSFLWSLSVHDVAQPYMERLARASGQTATLALLEGLEAIYIVVEHPQRDVGILGGIGQRYPAHATAVGKVLLAHLEAGELNARLSGRQLQRLTHRTIVDPEELVDELDLTRERGYAIDDEERGIGIRCVAVPIFDYAGEAVAAVSLSGPIFHLTSDAVTDCRDKLLEVATDVSGRLGYKPEAAVSRG